MGQPRKYENAAEKMRAYRERKRRQPKPPDPVKELTERLGGRQAVINLLMDRERRIWAAIGAAAEAGDELAGQLAGRYMPETLARVAEFFEWRAAKAKGENVGEEWEFSFDRLLRLNPDIKPVDLSREEQLALVKAHQEK